MSSASALPSLALILARSQFGFTVAFHIMFPAFSIGLASFLAVLEGAWLITKKPAYLDAFKYWLKIFAVVFTIGVVSGLVMAFEIGANWGGYANKVGPILGPLLTYETMSAFFLEAGFLGIMLFGLNKVGPRRHFAAAGQFIPTDWLKVIFNPSFPYRLVHMVIAAYLAVAFAVGGISAYHLLKGKQNPVVRLAFSMAMWMAVIVTPIQIFAGDTQGRNTLDYQPAKLAAIEGDFDSGTQSLSLLGWPDVAAGKMDYDIAIPHLGSLILTHEWNGSVKGLNSFPRSDWPVVDVTFFTFRIMVGLGMLMLLVGLLSIWLRVRGQLYDSPWFQRLAVLVGPTGFLAIIAGWTTTEAGRQPWTVEGLLRTADSVSPITLHEVETSFAVIIIVYLIVIGSGIRYLLKMGAPGPELGEPPPHDDAPLRSHGRHGLMSPTNLAPGE